MLRQNAFMHRPQGRPGRGCGGMGWPL